ncbi:GerAB/ArcD/ProY family transporter [Gorillibacterium sp. sgz5001074]|uniref:GerAB/ArcD/ProY family transporter n=1 Tax=Gorillibacterium sp. sgz5001074 TaxID=3446695 RepID=UPI003F67F9AB
MKIRISEGMLMAMIMSMVYAKALGVTQGVMAREIYGDIWLATLFSTLKGAAIMLLTVMIIKRMPSKTILEQAEILLGRWPAKALGLLLFVFFTGAFATIMITFVYHIMDYFLPQAPTYLFFIVALSVALYGMYKGLEVIGRTSLLAILCMVVFNILMILGSLQQMDLKELRPVVESGFLQILHTSRHNDTDWGMATLMTALILPVVAPKEKWTKAGVIGIVYGGIIVVLWPILEVVVLSPEMVAQYIVSCMQLARSAEIGVFMHRYEMIMVAMFIIPLFVQILLCEYCAVKALSYTFGADKQTPFYIPVTLVLGGSSYYVVSSHFRAMEFLSQIWPYMALPLAYGVPLLVLAAGFLRKSRLKPSARTK